MLFIDLFLILRVSPEDPSVLIAYSDRNPAFILGIPLILDYNFAPLYPLKRPPYNYHIFLLINIPNY